MVGERSERWQECREGQVTQKPGRVGAQEAGCGRCLLSPKERFFLKQRLTWKSRFAQLLIHSVANSC